MLPVVNMYNMHMGFSVKLVTFWNATTVKSEVALKIAVGQGRVKQAWVHFRINLFAVRQFLSTGSWWCQHEHQHQHQRSHRYRHQQSFCRNPSAHCKRASFSVISFQLPRLPKNVNPSRRAKKEERWKRSRLERKGKRSSWPFPSVREWW